MAGTLFGLGLSVQYDASGIIAPGALLYIYQANSSTPVTTYSDFGLTVTQTWPIVADGSGRLPQIWVADGSYRARLTTSAGVTIFDEQSVTAIGSSSGSSSSGSSVDSTTIFTTGDVLWVPYAGTRSGWVRGNARTIGNAASGGTERANADTAALFAYFWNNFSNTLCAVSGGRGATAVADFAASKTIGTLDMRGRGPFGLDDMGNSAASVIAAGTPTVGGSGSGAETVTLTTSNLPSYNLSVASITGSVGTALSGTNGTSNILRNQTTAGNLTGGGGGAYIQSASTTALTLSDGTVTFGGSIPSGGGGAATNKMPPYRLGTFYFKL